MAVEGKLLEGKLLEGKLLEGKLRVKEERARLVDFVMKGEPADLLKLLRQTGLADHPQVRNYDDVSAPAFYHQEADLRRFVKGQVKNHADLRNMMLRLLAAKAVAGK